MAVPWLSGLFDTRELLWVSQEGFALLADERQQFRAQRNCRYARQIACALGVDIVDLVADVSSNRVRLPTHASTRAEGD